MPEYSCRGIDKNGKQVEQTFLAANEGELRMILRAQGIRPLRIKQGGKAFTFKSQGVPVAMMVIFTRQLHVLINSGIPLLQSLEILVDQANHPALKNVLVDIKEKVSKGAYLWETLSHHPKAFPRLYVALIRAGESSGSLDNMLKRLSRYMEDADRLKKQLKGAMMYPIIVIIIGIGVIAAMLGFVIPKFEAMLKGAGQELPLPTLLVITASHALIDNFMYIAGGITAAVVLLTRYLQTEEGRAFKDRIVFHLPLFGKLSQMAGVARFARTMQTLLASGINLIDAIEICRNTIDNVVLEEATAKIRAEVESGSTLAMSIGKIKVFPRMTYQMIQVGESTGSLDRMLEKIADFYEADVEALIGGMSKLIEPIILVFLGGTVGGLMIAMYLPIFKLAGGAE